MSSKNRVSVYNFSLKVVSDDDSRVIEGIKRMLEIWNKDLIGYELEVL
jgi:hypothetical protein